MTLPRELTAPHTNVKARKLVKGQVIRFVNETMVQFSDESEPRLESVVFIGRVGKDVYDNGVSAVVDVSVDLLGRFQFNPETMVEVILDPEGMQLPYGEEMDLEFTATRASRSITDFEFVTEVG